MRGVGAVGLEASGREAVVFQISRAAQEGPRRLAGAVAHDGLVDLHLAGAGDDVVVRLIRVGKSGDAAFGVHRAGLEDDPARAFGSLNIYATQPNAFTADEVRLLEELADDLAFGIVTLRSRSARERAEQEVALLTFALDKVHEAAFLMDEARLAYVNEAACRRLGYSREELLRVGVADIDPDFPVERWAEHWRELKARRSLTFESRHRTREGRIFPVEISANYFEFGGRAYNLALARDITERKRTEADLRRTWGYLAETQRLTHTGTAVADPTTAPVYWSEEMYRIFGFDPQQGLPTRDQPLERVHSEDRDKFQGAFQRAITEKVDVDVEYRVVLPDGNVKQIYGLGHPVLNDRGELVEIVCTVMDISERKRAEEALRRSEACLIEGQRLSHTGSWAWSPVTFKSLYWSEEMSRIYGLNPQDGPPTADLFWQRIHPEDRDRARELLLKAVAEKRGYEHDLRIVLPDGAIKHIHAVGHPVFDEAGNLVEYFGTSMDMTERRRAEEALRRSEAYLAEGQRLAQMGSWAWNPATHQVLYWSEEMFRIFGLNPRDGVPTTEAFVERLHPDDRADVLEFMVQVSRRGLDYEHHHRIVLPDGTVKHIQAVGRPVRDEAGHLVEYVGTALDVTERKLVEEELRKHREHLEGLVKQRTEQLAEAKARAEAANRAKSTFLANMSHELRTPLNAVLGFSRLLKNDPAATPMQRETLDVIVRSGEHLLNLINNVLDMAKIEAGRVVLQESEVDLLRLLHEMQSLMGAGAVEQGLRFALEHDPDLPRFVAVDAGKLRQVLLNLLGNAIKHTESGGVKLRARLASLRGAEKARVRFEVEDTGPGISPEDCQRLFAPFVQLGDQPPARAGTGLGLAICKQYVEVMGGQIGVNSQPGKGSVFHFEIPVTLLSAAAEREEPKPSRVVGLAEGQPRHRLLIVEDQPENRLLLRRILHPLGFEMREATNGQEAVALFEQWHPDLIWMDIRMPVMDGLEATRRIRATPTCAQTKIVALTAHALEEEREPIMAAGCDDLVRKPFHEQELFGALARHLGLKFIHEQPSRPEGASEPPGLAVRPEQLAALPPELLRELRQAVIELDTARTQTLIAQVAGHDAALGQALGALATRLDYPRLLKLLEREQPETGR